MRTAPFRVLLIDDNQADTELAQAAFRRASPATEMLAVEDGDEALAYLRHQLSDPGGELPDLVLLDLNLPRMNGREVLRAVRADPGLMHLPVVILSTSSAPRDVRDLYRLHASAYVEKPLTLARFAEIVSAMEAFWFDAARLPSA